MATVNKTMKTLNVPNGQDTICYEIFDDAGRKLIAPDWADVSSSAFAIGDYIVKDGKVYCFKATHVAGTAWSASEVDEVTVGGELKAIKSDLSGMVPSTRKVNNKALSADITLDKSDIGLGNVDNTSDANKPVSTATQTALNAKMDANLRGAANGVAELDSTGKVPSSQLPSYVDDALEYDSLSGFPATGESGKIYVAKDTNLTYRWTGTTYVEISPSLALGETSSTAYRGDRGKAAYDHASDSGKIGTAKTAGLYKMSVTSEGHVGSAEAAQQSDITALGIKGEQSAVADPTASGNAFSFIDSISQNAQGVISPTKKTVPVMTGATASDDGEKGLAPAPEAGDENKFLAGDGTWKEAITDTSGKADKVSGATSGNFAGLDKNGNLTDSGSKASDFLTQHQDISGKADKVSGATNGNLAGLDENGNLTDSGKNSADFIAADDLDDTAGIGDTTKVWSADKTASELAEKSGIIFKSISTPAAIQSFDDGADDLPIKEMKIGIEPQQDLHGYDHPWPAGGGKNLLPLTVDGLKAKNTSGTWSRNVYSINNLKITLNTDNDGNIISIKVNGTASDSTTFTFTGSYIQNVFKGYKLSGCSDVNSDTYKLYIAYSSNGTNWANEAYQTTSDLVISSDYDYMDVGILVRSGVQVNNKLFYPMIRSAAVSDTTFEPYSNICPITGWTGAKAVRTRKNLLPIERNSVLQSSNGYAATITVDAEGNMVINKPQNVYSTFVFPSIHLPAGTYRAYELTDGINGNDTELYFYKDALDGDYTYLCRTSWNKGGNTNTRFTLTEDTHVFIRYGIYNSSTNREVKLGLYREEEYTGYVAPEARVYPIAFPSSAGTVYGGELTVNENGTGTLVVDHACVDLGNFDYDSDGNYPNIGGRRWNTTLSPTAIQSDTSHEIAKCSIAKMIHSGGTAATFGFTITNSSVLLLSDINLTNIEGSAVKTYLTGQKLWYKLATPQTYAISAPEVRTLLGTNNIYADTGDINSITYRTDESINYELDKISGTDIHTTETASIAQFETDSEQYAKGYSIGIEPVQDLHGYDHPWPAGGGKNLFSLMDDFVTTTMHGITITRIDESSFKLNGTADAQFDFDVYIKNGYDIPYGEYHVKGEGLTGRTLMLKRSGGQSRWIDNDSSVIVGETDYPRYWHNAIASGTIFNNLLVRYQLEAGSTATAYAPYSNICPITWRTSAEVKRTGKNILPAKFYEGLSYNLAAGTQITFTETERAVTKNGDKYIINDTVGWRGLTMISEPLKTGNKYKCNIKVSATDARSTIYILDENNIIKSYANAQVNYVWNNVYDGHDGYRIAIHLTTRIPGTFTFDSPQIEIGETATPYEPYSGESYAVIFPSEAGTVYGGELTVEQDGSGTLVVDKALAVYTGEETFTWTRRVVDGRISYYHNHTQGPIPMLDRSSVEGRLNMRSNLFENSFKKPGIYYYSFTCSDMMYINYNDPSIETAEDFKALLAAWYQNGTPLTIYGNLLPQYVTTYHLTAPQVKLLKGLNNVWADSGDISVTYRDGAFATLEEETALETRLIEAREQADRVEPTQGMIAPSEEVTATENHPSGDVFVCEDKLLRATSTIASGETISTGSGGNAEAVTVAGLLTEQATQGGGSSNMTPVENGNTATQNYAAGIYLTWKGTTYRTKTAIDSGDSFTIGTNLETLPDGVINALNASIKIYIDSISIPSMTANSVTSVSYTLPTELVNKTIHGICACELGGYAALNMSVNGALTDRPLGLNFRNTSHDTISQRTVFLILFYD